MQSQQADFIVRYWTLLVSEKKSKQSRKRRYIRQTLNARSCVKVAGENPQKQTNSVNLLILETPILRKTVEIFL